jgi:hypothetical protein
MRSYLSLLAAISGMALGGCGMCDDSAVAAFAVAVHPPSGGHPSDLTLTFTCASQQQTVTLAELRGERIGEGADVDCSVDPPPADAGAELTPVAEIHCAWCYEAHDERPGSFAAEAAGYRSVSFGVEAIEDGCHPDTQQFDILLEPG